MKAGVDTSSPSLESPLACLAQPRHRPQAPHPAHSLHSPSVLTHPPNPNPSWARPGQFKPSPDLDADCNNLIGHLTLTLTLTRTLTLTGSPWSATLISTSGFSLIGNEELLPSSQDYCEALPQSRCFIHDASFTMPQSR